MMNKIVVCGILMVSLSDAFADDKCASSDLAIKACVKQSLIDDNIIINGMISDPGGGKTKTAADLCQYDCSVHSVTFEAKWSQFRDQQN
jgi:hypothetical protein